MLFSKVKEFEDTFKTTSNKTAPFFPCSLFQLCKHSLGYPVEDLHIMSWNQLSSFIPWTIFSPDNHSMTTRQDFKNKWLIPCPCSPLTQIKKVTTKVNPNKSVQLFPLRENSSLKPTSWLWPVLSKQCCIGVTCGTCIWFGGFLHTVTLKHPRSANPWGRRWLIWLQASSKWKQAVSAVPCYGLHQEFCCYWSFSSR